MQILSNFILQDLFIKKLAIKSINALCVSFMDGAKEASQLIIVNEICQDLN
jgi:hypothetical protein